MFGISAGGSMILATILKAQDEGLPLPGAVGAMSSGAVDFTTLGDTGHTLDGLDPVLRAELVRSVGIAYAGGADLHKPLISPLYVEYSDKFPPTIIQTGTRDLFLSGCARLHRNMKDAGVEVELSVWEGMWHGFHIFPNTTYPEAEAAFNELTQFFDKKLKLQLKHAK